jgi:hypothetical protein
MQMKKRIIPLIFALVIFMGMSSQAWSEMYVHFALTTDVLELIDEDYQAEFMHYISAKSAFAVRLGYYRTLEDSNKEYSGDTRHWELGGRWRYDLIDIMPNFLLFAGIGFDNRPQDNTVTPLGEIGSYFFLKPFFVMVVGFGGYEIDVTNSDNNRDVWGIEARVGFGF